MAGFTKSEYVGKFPAVSRYTAFLRIYRQLAGIRDWSIYMYIIYIYMTKMVTRKTHPTSELALTDWCIPCDRISKDNKREHEMESDGLVFP